MGGKTGNMYELVYSKGKSLKDDNRLAYYSFFTIMQYKEILSLGLFSMIYTSASGINIQLVHSIDITDYSVKWPFVRYAQGAFVGLIMVALISDFIF